MFDVDGSSIQYWRVSLIDMPPHRTEGPRDLLIPTQIKHAEGHCKNKHGLVSLSFL
jgi:hypothetical protein